MAVRQVGRADQSKVTELQITSKDFPKRGHARVEQELRRNNRGCSKFTGAGVREPNFSVLPRRVLRHPAAGSKDDMQLQVYPEPGSATLCLCRLKRQVVCVLQALGVRQYGEIRMGG